MTGLGLRFPLATRIRQPLHRLRTWRETERGQSLVETALVIPFLLILLFALVDFGRGFYTWLVVVNAAREGARVGAVQAPASQINTRISDSLGALDPAELTVTLTNVQGPRGEPVEVDLSYNFQFVTPIGALLQLMTGDNLSTPTITAHSSMRLE